MRLEQQQIDDIGSNKLVSAPFNCEACNTLVLIESNSCPFEELCIKCYDARQQDAFGE